MSESTAPITTESGLVIEELVIGSGTEAKSGDTVIVHYTGWLTDGSKFDSSKDRDDPFSFGLGRRQVIGGWDEGVQGMKVGGTRKLTIPPDLGYGARGAGGVIPPNATLVFEVELLDLQVGRVAKSMAEKTPVTAAVRILRQHRATFTDHLYQYEEKGGTAVSSRELGVDEHAVVKTLVMEDDSKRPLIVADARRPRGIHQESRASYRRQDHQPLLAGNGQPAFRLHGRWYESIWYAQGDAGVHGKQHPRFAEDLHQWRQAWLSDWHNATDGRRHSQAGAGQRSRMSLRHKRRITPPPRAAANRHPRRFRARPCPGFPR